MLALSRRQRGNLFPSHHHRNDTARTTEERRQCGFKYTPQGWVPDPGFWDLHPDDRRPSGSPLRALLSVLIMVFSLRSVLSNLHFTSQQTVDPRHPRRSLSFRFTPDRSRNWTWIPRRMKCPANSSSAYVDSMAPSWMLARRPATPCTSCRL